MDYGEMTPDDVFDKFWKELVCDSHGNLIPVCVKNELYDYSVFLQEVAKVYDHVTGGMISKQNTKAEAVIDEADEYYKKLYYGDFEELFEEIDDLLFTEPYLQHKFRQLVTEWTGASFPKYDARGF